MLQDKIKLRVLLLEYYAYFSSVNLLLEYALYA